MLLIMQPDPVLQHILDEKPWKVTLTMGSWTVSPGGVLSYGEDGLFHLKTAAPSVIPVWLIKLFQQLEGIMSLTLIILIWC